MRIQTTRGLPPHAGQRVHAAGADLKAATGAMILIHGRGGSAADILTLSGAFRAPGMAFLAPEAAGHVWYPYRFIEPTARNEPYLGSAVATVISLIEDVIAAGISEDRLLLLGFSQGACLATEVAARRPARYGGVIGLSGGLIGADGEIGPKPGSLAGTPVILGCSDVDAHIPLSRVQATTKVLSAMGAVVDETIYPGMGHGIVDDEIRRIQALIDSLCRAPAAA